MRRGRPSISAFICREYGNLYPFGLLEIFSRAPPAEQESIYASHAHGFALCSPRHKMLSRYYIQVPLTDKLEDWSDDDLWTELKTRLPDNVTARLITGSTIEKSIAPLRSFVTEPMRWGNLFLCGDAAHIVPPTGAKGLNLAASNVQHLSEAMFARYTRRDASGLEEYSAKALARIWQATRFSWSMTTMMHRFRDHDDYGKTDAGRRNRFFEKLLGGAACFSRKLHWIALLIAVWDQFISSMRDHDAGL